MGLGFLVDQIYLVSLGNYDPHAKSPRFFWFFIYQALYSLHQKGWILKYFVNCVACSDNAFRFM